MCIAIFIIGPIMIIAYSITAPLYLQIMLLVWVIILMMSFILGKEISTSLTISIIATLIMSFVFASWYAEEVLRGEYNDGGLGETIGVFSAVSFSAIPICFIATIVRQKIDAARNAKEQMRINNIKQEIKGFEKEINRLETQLNKKQTILNLLRLIELCGTDVSYIENSSEICDIRQLTDEISQKNCQIKELSDKLSLHKRN